MNYLVIDLEMCKVPKNYRGKNYKYASEIIQVGAVLLDEEYKEIGTLCQYVHPEFGILDYFITNLTGIEKGQIKNAPKLKDALIHMESGNIKFLHGVKVITGSLTMRLKVRS